MCLSILKANGEVIPRRSWRPLKVDELHSEEEKKKQAIFDALIERRWGSLMRSLKTSTAPTVETVDKDSKPYSDPDKNARTIPEHEDVTDINGNLINQQSAYDRLIDAEVAIHHDKNETVVGKVKHRTVDHNGNTARCYNDNLHLNTMVYDVEFPYGKVKEYSANIIAENILTQVDEEGFSTTMLCAIIDHVKDENMAINKCDEYVVNNRGVRHPQKTTQGWKLTV